MGSTQIGDDRISKLADGVLGHILSFLPAQEAARVAVLSTRWRDVFASVHTVSLEEPEKPIPSYDDDHYCSSPGYGPPKDPNPPPPFTAAIPAALLARHRRVRSGPAAQPLRALRVDMERYRGGDLRTVDNWVSYALKQAGAELELDLRLCRATICGRPCSLHAGGGCAVTLEFRGGTAVSPEEDIVEEQGNEDVLKANDDVTSEEYTGSEISLSVQERDMDVLSNADGVSGEFSGGYNDGEYDDSAADDVNEAITNGEYDDADDSAADNVSEAMTDGGYDDAVDYADDDVSEAMTDGGYDDADDDVNEAMPDGGYDDPDDSAADDVSEAMTDGEDDDADVSAAHVVNEARPDGGCEYDDADDSSADDISEAMTDGEYDDVVSSESEKVAYVSPWDLPPPEYTVPMVLFSCTALRSLRIGPCRLSPPATITLPSLAELLLTRVSDGGHDVERLISACPCLADLTLEACDTVTTLSLLDTRLRRLALRCCHNLASVALDSSELQAFEYRGTVPEDSFLTMRGASRSSLTSCKVDICGEEAWSPEELTNLREFLQLFVGTKHLHLQSARLGSGFHNDTFISFQEFSNLRHIEMMGCLPHDDDTIVSAMSRILQHAPELEVLSLVFQPEPEPGDDDEWLPGGHYGCKERELLGVHHLQYNQHNVLDAPTTMIACLTHRVREINLVHYQGGRAQRTLAKFLLCNALVLDELYCGIVPGPLWIQTELRREIEGWAMNKPQNRIFY